jgi:hypothetical protein
MQMGRIARLGAQLGLLLLLVACPAGPDDDDAIDDDDSVDDDDTIDDDDSVDDDDDDAVDDDDTTSPPDPSCFEGADGLNVTIRDEAGLPPLCPDDPPFLCADGYDDFFDHPQTGLEASPLPDCDGFVQEMAEAAALGQPVPLPTVELSPDDDLGDVILDLTNMGFLFESPAFDDRPLDVVTTGEQLRTSGTGSTYRQRTLLLRDEFIGEVQALLLLPPTGEGPFPTALALPGHVEGPVEHRDWRFGQYFPENGFALLIVTFRAYQQPSDHEVSVEFLCQGFHLMTFRAYEALVALKYLLASPLACNSQLGMIGHSGGSITGGLLVWMQQNPARAFVTDGGSLYYNVDPFDDPEIPWAVDCETHLGLAAIAESLNDYDLATMPVQLTPYAYGPEFGSDEEPAWDDLSALDWFIPFFREQLIGE